MKVKLLSVLALLAVFLASCGASTFPRIEVSSFEERTAKVDIPLQLELDCENGDTEVYSWTRDEVKLEITKIVHGNREKAQLQKLLDDFNISVDSEKGKLILKSDFRNRSGDVEGLLRLRLYLPKETTSFSLVQKNGSMTFLDDFDGDIDVDADKLDLDINRLEGRLGCKLERGDLRVSSGKLESGSSALLTNGNIRIKAAFENPGDYSFKTDLGILELNLPENANAVFETYGRVESADFDPGGNPARFRLESHLGEIRIRKY